MDGWGVLRTIRQDSQTPVIMLTAKGETNDKVQGLKQGADGRIDGVSNLVAGVGGGRDDPVKPLLAHELLHDQLGHGAAADISGADEHDSNHWLADPFSDGSIGTTSTTVSRPSETVK